MIAHTEPFQPVVAPGPPRSVALVGRYAHQHLEDAMLGVADCNVVIVESTRTPTRRSSALVQTW